MFNRREFLTGCAAATLGVATARSQAAVVTRRSVRGMAANDPDLVAYRRAVAAMKALPASDPRNWNRFADIHGNYCPHANWYFLPWHRAYLTALERICRDLSGKPDFALPYWDWTNEREVPPAFVAGTPSSNPLNHPRPAYRAELRDDMVGRAVIARILASPDFEALGSTRPRGQTGTGNDWQRRRGASTELEANAHNGVHNALGGDMATPERAARDPIFYLHHANIDRLWSLWNMRGNENSREGAWRGFTFLRNFPNPNGSPWTVTVGDLQSPPALGYQYDRERIGAADGLDAFAAAQDEVLARRLAVFRSFQESGPPRANEVRTITMRGTDPIRIVSATNERSASNGQPISISVPLGGMLGDLVQPAAVSADGASRSRQCVWAMIRDIEPPRDASTRVNVFVNCADLSTTTGTDNPHCATSLSFFGSEHGAHHAGHLGATPGTSAMVDLSGALARIRNTPSFRADRLTVQLLPVCDNRNVGDTQCRPRAVDIVII